MAPYHRRHPSYKAPRLRHPQHRTVPTPHLAPSAVEGPTPMRVLVLIYHEDFEEEITSIVQRQMLVARYTRIRDVVGARADALRETEYHTGGRNDLLIIVAEQEIITLLAEQFRALRQAKGHGLRGYITPVESLI